MKVTFLGQVWGLLVAAGSLFPGFANQYAALGAWDTQFRVAQGARCQGMLALVRGPVQYWSAAVKRARLSFPRPRNWYPL